jgi:hypothetical protein
MMPWCALAGLLLGFALMAIGALVCFQEIMAPDGRLWMLPPALVPGALTLGMTFLIVSKLK